MSIPICTICGTAMLYIPCPCLQPRCSVAHYSCPNGPEDSPYHKLFLELVAVRKIVFEYKERIAELEAIPPEPADVHAAAMHRCVLREMVKSDATDTFQVALLRIERDSARNGRHSWMEAQRAALDTQRKVEDERDALCTQLEEAHAEIQRLKDEGGK